MSSGLAPVSRRQPVDPDRAVDNRSARRRRSRGRSFPIPKRSRVMCGRKSYKRFAGLGVAIVLFAGVGVAIVLVAGQFQFPSPSPRTVRTDQREARSIAAGLVTAIRNADVRVVRQLFDNGADVNARDAEGNTPLILASFYASPECVELLIEKGADVNAANKAGATPLIRAATDYEKTRLLVTAGANIQVRTALGNTALILAARRAGNVCAHGLTWPGARVLAMSAECAPGRHSLPTCGTDCRPKPKP